MTRAHTIRTAALAGLVGCAVALCGAATAAAQPSAAPGIVVRDAWVRETTALRTASAGYMTIENRTAREITVVGVTIAGAKRAELHRVVQADGQGGMAAVASLRIPPHSSVTLEPGGTHVMIFDVAPPFVRGRSVAVTLTLGDRRAHTVAAVVRPLSAMSAR